MKVKKALCFLFALIMLLSFMPTVQKVYAEEISEEISEEIPEEIPEETTKFDVSGSKTADPTELEGDDRKTTVTLSLPSAEYQNEIDIVFTMDSSTSAQNSTVFTESVNELFASIIENNPGIKMKVGVIRFRGRAHDAVAYLSDNQYKELVEYNDDTKDYINAALNMTEDEIKKAFGSGSNTHGGIDIANEWLKADTEVDDDHKYMVLLTDAKTYIWNNDDHEPTTIYSQWYRWTSGQTAGVMQNNGIPALNQVAGYNKYDYALDVLDKSGKSNIFVFRTIEDLLASESTELTGVSDWDEPCRYADGGGAPQGSAPKRETTNGAALFGSNSAVFGNFRDYQYFYEYTPNDNWTGVKYLEGNPLKIIKNVDGTYTYDYRLIENEDGTTSLDPDCVNPNYYQYHVDCLQKGIYKAGKLWEEVVDKYNCAVITYSGGSGGGGLELRAPFIEWFHENSDFSADILDSEGVEAMFEGIDNDIRYMVSKGVVTDKITSDFTLKNDDNADGFRMTYDGEALDVTYDDGKWNFGTADDEGVYPYVVEYDADTKTITWTINVPIENLNPVTLSYDLILRENAGSAFYDTNVEAVLDYVTSDEKEGSFTFEIPKVSYIRHIDIPVEKYWEDNDNEYNTRPDSISIRLLADEEEVDTVDLSDDGNGNWVYTFEDLPDSKLVEVDGEKKIEEIEYVVEEPETVAGYKAPEIQVAEGVVEAGVYIINTQEDLVTITYKLNGGSYNGDTSDIIEKYPKGVVINIHEAPVRNGYTFLYWKGSEFDPGDEYTVTEDHEFVAQWKEGSPQTGEENSILLWVLIMAIAYIELFGVMLIEKKRRMNRSHE